MVAAIFLRQFPFQNTIKLNSLSVKIVLKGDFERGIALNAKNS